jgi:competence ComEA-like helix-hairpin-helix protein
MDDKNIPVNLNTAEREELMTLPGVGPAIAERILENRPFTSIEDLQRISGIGSSFVEGIRAMVTVNNDNSPAGAPAGEPDEATPAQITAEPQESPVEIGLVEADQESEPDAQFEAKQEILSMEEAPEAEPGEPAPESGAVEEVFTVPEGQKPGPQAEFAPPSPQPTTTAQPTAVTRSQALWMAVGTGFLALVMAFILSLGVLAIINGGLRFVSPADLNALGHKVDGVTTQTQLLQQDLDGLRSRVNNLEGLSGRVSTVEGQVKQLRTDLDDASQQVQQINQQLTQVSSDIKDLQTQTGRFQGFLDGLKSLLNQVMQP